MHFSVHEIFMNKIMVSAIFLVLLFLHMQFLFKKKN